jgi:4-hydroxy-3-polyprenylbenzoate decarboxylase
MLGLAPDTHPRELVKIGRTLLEGKVPPRIVKEGPCKENVVTGKDINLYDFPVPQWNRVDGGRYLLTYGGVVTKDPTTGVMNVGIYRGMVSAKDRIPILMWRAQHIGHHVTAWQNGGSSEMPIAVAIGWEPSLGFTGGSPVPKGVCEYDVMGSIRGEPVDLVKCETVDLYVPATAEIVIEGYLQLDPKNHDMEGPFAEFTGYVAGDKSPKPTIRVTAITHRNNPILRGAIEGSLPGSYSENGICSSIMRASTAWNVLDRAGVPGIAIRPSRSPMRSGVLQRRMCATSTSLWSMTISTFTTTPRWTGPSRTVSTPARTPSSSCRPLLARVSIRRPASATVTLRCSAPASGTGC